MNYEKQTRAQQRDELRSTWRVWTLKKEHQPKKGWNRSVHREAITSLRMMGVPISKRDKMRAFLPEGSKHLAEFMVPDDENVTVFVRYATPADRRAAKRVRRARRG